MGTAAIQAILSATAIAGGGNAAATTKVGTTDSLWAVAAVVAVSTTRQQGVPSCPRRCMR